MFNTRSARTGSFRLATWAPPESGCRDSLKAIRQSLSPAWTPPALAVRWQAPCPISTENNVNQRRLDSGCTLANPNNCIYSSVGEIASVANSSYNALETSLRKRFSHGLSFLASYTWAHSIDDVSSFNITGSASQPVAGENDLAQDPFDLAAERGRSMFDSHNRFVLSYQWLLPFLQHSSSWYGHVLGNWRAGER